MPDEEAFDHDDLLELRRFFDTVDTNAQAVSSHWLLLRAKLDRLIVSTRRGARVFSMTLAIGAGQRGRAKRTRAAGGRATMTAWAPTLNEYNGLKPFEKSQLRGAIDTEIFLAGSRWGSWRMGVVRAGEVVRGKMRVKVSGGRRRLVEVTRYSASAPDEITADVIGGKIPIDRLVQAGVLRDDDAAWLVRRAAWFAVAPGEGRVVIDVYELPGAEGKAALE